MNLKKLDSVFSKFIRLRDSDDNGICRCITCKTPHYWSQMDNGHYIKRQHLALRFNEINCNAQCRKCNWLGQGEDALYKDAIIEKYGLQAYNKLLIYKNNYTKLSQFDVDTLEIYYKEKVKEYLLNKGIKCSH